MQTESVDLLSGLFGVSLPLSGLQTEEKLKQCSNCLIRSDTPLRLSWGHTSSMLHGESSGYPASVSEQPKGEGMLHLYAFSAA